MTGMCTPRSYCFCMKKLQESLMYYPVQHRNAKLCKLCHHRGPARAILQHLPIDSPVAIMLCPALEDSPPPYVLPGGLRTAWHWSAQLIQLTDTGDRSQNRSWSVEQKAGQSHVFEPRTERLLIYSGANQKAHSQGIRAKQASATKRGAKSSHTRHA